jgi:hypothetical protein
VVREPLGLLLVGFIGESSPTKYCSLVYILGPVVNYFGIARKTSQRQE